MHSHSVDASVRVRRLLLAAVFPFVIATLIGLITLWPREGPAISGEVGFTANLVDGEIVAIGPASCGGDETDPQSPGPECKSLDVRITNGANKGKVVTPLPAEEPPARSFSVGDKVALGYSPEATPDLQYYFADFKREVPLLLLSLLFAAVVVALGRWKGLAALGGFALSLGVITFFVLPAILSGKSPLLVSIVGASAVMLLALYLAHGVNVQTTSAVLGTFVSLGITGILALIFVQAASLTGFASEEAIFVNISASQVNLQGLLLGGILIGSLGVLDDVTITQASAVWELHAANPDYRTRELYRSALRIGRDHIASTVNTLVLAYAGASLPLLILFTLSGARFGTVVNGEIVAQEIVRTLVGSVGLVASVPVTTALASFVASRDVLRQS
jgi:uncharacterized membrane protein